jgi:hypothetical protein
VPHVSERTTAAAGPLPSHVPPATTGAGESSDRGLRETSPRSHEEHSARLPQSAAFLQPTSKQGYRLPSGTPPGIANNPPCRTVTHEVARSHSFLKQAVLLGGNPPVSRLPPSVRASVQWCRSYPRAAAAQSHPVRYDGSSGGLRYAAPPEPRALSRGSGWTTCADLCPSDVARAHHVDVESFTGSRGAFLPLGSRTDGCPCHEFPSPPAPLLPSSLDAALARQRLFRCRRVAMP